MKLHNTPCEPYHFPILFESIKPQTNAQGHVTRLLLGASLGPQVKDHTTRLLSGALLGPQIKDLITWLLPGASFGPQIKDQTTLFLPGASLGPQVSCVTIRSFVRLIGKLCYYQELR
jgi:hypothetical protein